MPSGGEKSSAKRVLARRSPTQRPSSGFDFTHHMRLLCNDIVHRTPELQFIDLSRVAISFSQARKAVSHGLHATLTPMRFEEGSLYTSRGGKRWTVQRLYTPEDREILYILSFYLPRFLEGPLREKLETVIHELWHISPAFDGDLRRFSGRCYAHSHSQGDYDAQVREITDRWLSLSPPADLYSFLRHNLAGLQRTHGAVYGTKIRAPKLIPVEDAGDASKR